MHFFIFFNLANKFFKVSHINKVIYVKLPIIKFNLTCDLIKIVILVIFYSLYRKINPHLLYISNI